MASMVQLPKSVYRLSSKTGHMNARYNDKSYVVGFLFHKHAAKVMPHVCDLSKVEVADFISKHNSRLRVEKKVNINRMPLEVTEEEFIEFLAMPFINNVGTMLVYDIEHEDKDEFLLDVQFVEDEYNPELVAKRLSNRMK